MMGEKVLVTGGAGFIGSFLVDRLVESGYDVRIFDNLDGQVHSDSKRPEYLNGHAEFIKGDIRNYDVVKKAIEGAEVIFHLAACVGVGQSQYEIKKYVDVNIGGTANLLDILCNEKNKVKKLIVAGSMSSYGEGLYSCDVCGEVRPPLRNSEQMEAGDWELKCPGCSNTLNPLPTREENELNCTSIYAFTKKMQEETSLIIGETYDIAVTVLRYFNVYGPRQSLSNPYTGVVAIFLCRLMNSKAPVIYEDGEQTRDFISVHDITEANLAVLNNNESDYKVFNVGSGDPISISEIARILSDLTRRDIEPKITGEFRRGDIRHCCADISLIKDTLGWQPRVSFRDGMQELIEWAQHEKAVDKFDLAYMELKSKGLL